MDRLGCETCAMFLKNQRMHRFKELEEEEAALFRRKTRITGIILPHGSYLINLANDKEERGFRLLIDDMKRCRKLGIELYNLHPGSNTQKNKEEAIRNVAKACNRAHGEVDGVVICLENMAGQGNTLGSNFLELRQIIDQVEDKERIGVCLDTCHLFGAGYDVRTAESFEKVMKEFDSVIGMKYLRAMHLNDSKCALGSRKDRHESLGMGLIGLDCFKFIMESDYFDGIPMILETPDPELYKKEIEMLRGFEKSE
ncbi:Endonuclease IV [Enterospora canceri]|uniref:Apurinic-apyrimidinic endonuclease 1 n=1 Tax=Enterospora canceri TaxID=1081671 RepID=A0A1Y1SAT4_9MICR|nr:Endonuclease IV [Enterospora canceri]